MRRATVYASSRNGAARVFDLGPKLGDDDMKRASYLLMGAALLWMALLAGGGDPEPRATAPIAAVLGLGFVLWTTAGVIEGSIRGSNRRIQRSDQPTTFWVAVSIYYLLAGLMLVGAIVLASR